MDLLEITLENIKSFEGSQLDKAILILSAVKQFNGVVSLPVRRICDMFERAHLARPNQTVLMRSLASDRRVSVRQRQVRALIGADKFLAETFPSITANEEKKTGGLSAEISVRLQNTPLIDANFVSDLEKMLELYATLHTLENSMRRLIEQVLSLTLGIGWWDEGASAPQKRKHEDRLLKESSRKWLPARSSLGPLYSLDWSDLISLMRKYEKEFIPYLGEIDFLHRFSDLGLVRHVVAHHGFIDDDSEYSRVKLALGDWQKQIGAALEKSAPPA